MTPKRRPKRIKISPSTLSELEKHAYSNLEAEVGGMLFGNIVGGQTNISGFIPALTASKDQISLTFTHEVWEEILREGSKKFPNDQIVGWYHTHPSFGLFLSEYDLFIQSNFFSLKGQLAFVIDPIAGEMGWFESVQGKAVQLSEEATSTGPKAVNKETDVSMMRKSRSPVLVAAASLVVGLCVGSGIALSSMPPNLSSVLNTTRGDRDLFESEYMRVSSLLATIQNAPVFDYTVTDGETFESIVTRFYGEGVDAQIIEEANSSLDLQHLVAGTTIRLPAITGLSVEIEPKIQSTDPTPNPTPTTTSPSSKK